VCPWATAIALRAIIIVLTPLENRCATREKLALDPRRGFRKETPGCSLRNSRAYGCNLLNLRMVLSFGLRMVPEGRGRWYIGFNLVLVAAS